MNLPPVLPDAPASNVVGETTSITLLTTQRSWGRLAMPSLFAISRAVPQALKAMDGLSFISFASWTLIRDLPCNGPPQSLRRLRHAHLFFEVHFNGSRPDVLAAGADADPSGPGGRAARLPRGAVAR